MVVTFDLLKMVEVFKAFGKQDLFFKFYSKYTKLIDSVNKI